MNKYILEFKGVYKEYNDAETKVAPLKGIDLKLEKNSLNLILSWGNLLPYLNVLENIMLPMIIKDRKKALEIIDVVGLVDKVAKFPDDLSSYEKQKTALARAMINDPVIIVANEPFRDLDDENTFKLMELLNKIKYKTSVLVLSIIKIVVCFYLMF